MSEGPRTKPLGMQPFYLDPNDVYKYTDIQSLSTCLLDAYLGTCLDTATLVMSFPANLCEETVAARYAPQINLVSITNHYGSFWLIEVEISQTF